MILGCNKYFTHFLQRSILSIGLILFFVSALSAQTVNVKTSTNEFEINPLLLTAFKKPAKATPMLAERMKPSKHELMYWPNYPLTAAKIEVRNREWEKRNRKTIGGQIVSDVASDIIKTQVNSLINGKKFPVAVVPGF